MPEFDWEEYAKDEWIRNYRQTPVQKRVATTVRNFEDGTLMILDHRDTVVLKAGVVLEIHSTEAVHLNVPARTWEGIVKGVTDYYIHVDYLDDYGVRSFRVNETYTRYLGWTGILYRIKED